MRIAAVADVHSPKFLSEFSLSLSKLRSPELFLLAGDIVNFGKAAEYRNVIDAIDLHLNPDLPIVACFGNEEFAGIRNDILESTANRVTFLDNESITFDYGDSKLGVVGTHAPFENPSGSNNLGSSDIRRAFESRAKRLSRILQDTARKVDDIILLMHYSPLSENKIGTDYDSFSWWISQATESVQPDLIFHGHVHNPVKRSATIGETRVLNVAFPAKEEVTEINL
ncbi:MAG: metallophosphoesterase [Candidatus Hermodarchaeota archaeon]